MSSPAAFPESRSAALAGELLRDAARAAAPPTLRGPRRAARSHALLMAAVAIVVLSAGWIARLQLQAGHAQQRVQRLVTADQALDALQIRYWRGVAGHRADAAQPGDL